MEGRLLSVENPTIRLNKLEVKLLDINALYNSGEIDPNLLNPVNEEITERIRNRMDAISDAGTGSEGNNSPADSGDGDGDGDSGSTGSSGNGYYGENDNQQQSGGGNQ